MFCNFPNMSSYLPYRIYKRTISSKRPAIPLLNDGAEDFRTGAFSCCRAAIPLGLFQDDPLMLFDDLVDS